jgi:hypothetical protein
MDGIETNLGILADSEDPRFDHLEYDAEIGANPTSRSTLLITIDPAEMMKGVHISLVPTEAPTQLHQG